MERNVIRSHWQVNGRQPMPEAVGAVGDGMGQGFYCEALESLPHT